MVEAETEQKNGIVVQQSDDGQWLATFVGPGPFTVKDVADVQRAVELLQREFVIKLRLGENYVR